MAQLCVFAPAKINLFLAITGRRPDGFHELTSLVCPLDWGDTLWLETCPGAQTDTLSCDVPGVPADASNLVLRAAAAFRERSKAGTPFVHFTLLKETPSGAGLGGGSSDAAAALRGLNHLTSPPLSAATLRECAAAIGSDVTLFLENRPVIMRGRGERIEPLTESARAVLGGQGILVFKPPFAIPTAWAYGRMKAESPAWYIAENVAETRLAEWIKMPTWSGLPLENNLEYPAFEKFAALPVLLAKLRERFNLRCRMSGSGSACFALLEPASPRAEIEQAIRAAWGPEAFVRAGRIA